MDRQQPVGPLSPEAQQQLPSLDPKKVADAFIPLFGVIVKISTGIWNFGQLLYFDNCLARIRYFCSWTRRFDSSRSLCIDIFRLFPRLRLHGFHESGNGCSYWRHHIAFAQQCVNVEWLQKGTLDSKANYEGKQNAYTRQFMVSKLTQFGFVISPRMWSKLELLMLMIIIMDSSRWSCSCACSSSSSA